MLAASLPFATGAMIYHWRDELLQWLGDAGKHQYTPVLLYGAIILNWRVGVELGTQTTWNFYLNYVLCSAMIVLLCMRRSMFSLDRKLDSAIGDLSYPIYLIHYPLVLLVSFFVQAAGFTRPEPGWVMLALNALPLLVLAWLMTFLVERPVERLRSAVKRRLILGQAGARSDAGSD
jgi:peptidoglycan/LPS O-acetylase OafA/YrhL